MHEMIGRELLSVKKKNSYNLDFNYKNFINLRHIIIGVRYHIVSSVLRYNVGVVLLPVVLLFSLSFISLHPEGM